MVFDKKAVLIIAFAIPRDKTEKKNQKESYD